MMIERTAQPTKKMQRKAKISPTVLFGVASSKGNRRPGSRGRFDGAKPIRLDGVAEPGRGQYGSFIPKSFEFTVRIHDISGGVEQLRKNGHDESWIVFLFGTSKKSTATDDQSLALQYSVANGRVGLDWVLVGPRNVADSSRVADFMRLRGHRVEQCEMNSVDFLRVEDGDLAGLGESILEVKYGVTSEQELRLVIDGIYLSTGKRTAL